ncbi:MAG: leucine-rich repeat domain-containing protein [Candidatus Hydrogenedentes bacterium]|nr:leucine-rich repeat domain-containing protein [Candidatus Hydrogenedentota bacterium]
MFVQPGAREIVNARLDLDKNLEEAVRIAIAREGDTLPLYRGDLDKFASLNASSRGITDLTGLEWCKGLVTLQLYNNNITDITQLTTLEDLQDLYLWDNQISDITALGLLKNLRYVFLHNNEITDISCLEYNASWESGDIVNISGNYIDQYGLCYVVPAMEKLGVLVYKDETAVCEQIRVNIPDPALELRLRWALNLRDEEIFPYIYDTDLQYYYDTGGVRKKFEFFIANDAGITDLTGLEYCTNLQLLNLEGNEISDITPIANLSLLNTLYLGGNNIEDIRPLAELYALTELGLQANQISDLTPLQALGGLIKLYLNENRITDLTKLQWLLNLKLLTLDNQKTTGIGPADGLINIDVLSRIAGLLSLSISGNSIANLAPLTPLVNLLELAVANNATPGEESCAGGDMSVASKWTLGASWRIADGTLTHSPGATATAVQDETDQAVPLEAGKKYGMAFTLSDVTAGSVTVFLGTGTDSITYNADGSYTTRIKALGVTPDIIFAPSADFAGSIDNVSVRNLFGITDVSPLQGLSDLYFLDASDNNISDISRLVDLKEMIYLYLHDNQITEVTVLAGYPNLSVATLANNKITDISPLVANAGLGDEWYGQPYPQVHDMVDVRGNTLSVENICNDIRTLRLRNVIVKTDEQQICDPFAESYTLTMSVAVTGSGTVEPPVGSRTYVSGTPITLNATPAEGFEFSRWEGDLESTENPVQIVMDSNKHITAVFAQSSIKYTLTVEISGKGTVTLDPIAIDNLYSSETPVKVTATADRAGAPPDAAYLCRRERHDQSGAGLASVCAWHGRPGFGNPGSRLQVHPVGRRRPCKLTGRHNRNNDER